MALTQISTQGIKDGTITGSDLATNVDLVDNQKLRLGTGSDFEIFHDGNNSQIKDVGTGSLILDTNGINIKILAGGSETMAKFVKDGAVELYYDNNKKFETTSSGVSVTGGLSASGASTFNEDVTFTGDNANILFDKDNDNIRVFDNASIDFGQSGDLKIHHSGHVNIIDDVQSKNISIQRGGSEQWKFGDGTFRGPDNKKIQLGNAQDLQIYHDGSHSYINNTGTGNLYIVDGGIVRIRTASFGVDNADGSEALLSATADGGVQLYYDNSTKIETRPTGLRMQNSSVFDVNGGTIQFGHSSSTDDRLKFGANDTDLQIFHGGNGQFDVNTGDVIIRNTGDFSSSREIYLMARVDEQSVTCKSDGAVELYYDNSKKFETTSNGATVSVASGDPQLIVTGPGHALLQLTSTSGTDHCGVNFGDNDDNNAGMIQYTNSTNAMQFHANGSERMRIDSAGKFLVGTTSGTNFNNNVAEFVNSTADGVVGVRSGTGVNQQDFITFKFGGGPTACGGIRRDGTTQGPELFSNSDRRIKTNILDMDNTLDKINQLSLKKFDFKDGSGSGIGLIAQDLISIFPSKVKKDDSDDGTGDTVPDGVDPWTVGHNFTYELLKAIQELTARVAALEAS